MQESKVKLLQKEFIGRGEVKGISFKRIKKSKYIYLYQVEDTYYEVFVRKVNKLYNTETYPSSRRFGKSAFTYVKKEEAIIKFNLLQKKEEKRAKAHNEEE